MTDGWDRQVAGMRTTTEYVISTPPCRLCSPCNHNKKRMSSHPVSPLLTSAPSVSAKWAHGSCINQQHGDPRLSPDAPTASGDLATGVVPLRWRIEPAATKQIWNHATLCHNFLHPTEVTWNAREPFSPICELKTLKRWASLAGGTQKQEERGCEPLRLCMWHRYLRCMTPVAISNIYTLTCVSQTTKRGFNL